jgi:hypothetical protein
VHAFCAPSTVAFQNPKVFRNLGSMLPTPTSRTIASAVDKIPAEEKANLRFAALILGCLAFSKLPLAQSISPVQVDTSSAVNGYWLGTLHASAVTRRLLSIFRL